MHATVNRIDEDRSVNYKALDWTTLGKLVRQRAAEALSDTGRERERNSPVPLNFGSGKDSESALT